MTVYLSTYGLNSSRCSLVMHVAYVDGLMTALQTELDSISISIRKRNFKEASTKFLVFNSLIDNCKFAEACSEITDLEKLLEEKEVTDGASN